MSLELRRIRENEFVDASALLAPEGWDFSPAELSRLDRLGGHLGAWRDDRLVAFLTWLDFPPVRWVGNVVTAKSERGRGVGAHLVDGVMKRPAEVPTVGLYAVERAVTLYERAGFRAQGIALNFAADAPTPLRRDDPTQPLAPSDLAACAALDRAVTGMDRAPLLAELLASYPKSGRVMRQDGRVIGYGFAKPYEGLTECGPIVGLPDAVEAMLDSWLADAPGAMEATVLAENERAIEALRARGFTQRFRVVPMFHGTPPRQDVQAIGAAAGLEKS